MPTHLKKVQYIANINCPSSLKSSESTPSFVPVEKHDSEDDLELYD